MQESREAEQVSAGLRFMSYEGFTRPLYEKRDEELSAEFAKDPQRRQKRRLILLRPET
jgi:hypothetical protein